MVVYTQGAVSTYGGLAALQSAVSVDVTETNQGYASSGVVQRMRLVHQGQVTYDESAGFNQSLNDVTNGVVPDVHSLRNAYGADIVSMIINRGEYCGLGWLMTSTTEDFAGYAYNVVSNQCLHNFTMAHEMGHNQGCHHDRANASQQGVFSYSYGYQYTGTPRFRTIMAYDCAGESCPAVNYWSNPEALYEGIPTGIVYTAANSADNRLSLNNTRTIAANWRQSVASGASNLFWRNIVDGRNKVWHYTGATLSSTTDYRTVNLVWRMGGTGDFNGDGQTDVVWRHSTTGENALWLLNAGTPTTVMTATVADLNWQIQATGDYDGNGITDLLWRNTSTGNNRIWYMNGVNQTGAEFPALPNADWAFAGTGDFNSDGKTDLVLRNYATGENAIWFMNGITVIDARGFDQIANGSWRIVAVTDFNGDNFPDIFWRNSATGKNSVWVMNSSLGHTTTWLGDVPNANWTIGGAGTF